MKKVLGIAVLASLFACNNINQSKDSQTKDSASVKTEDKTVTNKVRLKNPQIDKIYNNYIDLKNALVNSKIEEAQKASKSLMEDLKLYKGCEITALVAQKITNAKDIAAQRKAFTDLSSDVITLFKHAELLSGTIYIQHCPMANEGNGGDWLSSERKIQNPYYGSEMLECGSVLEEVKTK